MTPLILLPELAAGLVERSLDERTVRVRVHLFAEDPTGREDGHRGDLAPELRERLLMQLLGILLWTKIV